MDWFISKIVYQVICGNGDHVAQFDEQWRLISALNYEEAIQKSTAIGLQEEETFTNDKQQLVCWKFINVSELYPLQQQVDGAEIFSRIREVHDADAYCTFVHQKAASINQQLFSN